MEIYQLKTFIAVANEGHLTRAAKRLHTSQPAVSSHIKALEEELGVQLFERTPKGMSLTHAGEKLKIQAQIALDSVRDIKSQAKMIKENLTGIIKVGLNIDPQFLKLNDLLAYSRSHFPGLEFHLIQNMSWEAGGALGSGSLDCAFVYGKSNTEFIDHIFLKHMPVVVAAPIQWKDKILSGNWNDLGTVPWIMTPENCRFNEITQKIFTEKKIHPVTIAVADDESTIQRLVVSGAGVSLMIKDEARPLEKDGKITIWNQDVANLELYFTHEKKYAKSPNLKAVKESVMHVWNIS